MLVALCAGPLACQGQIEGAGAEAPEGTRGASGNRPGQSPTEVTQPGSRPSVGDTPGDPRIAQRIWRLSPAQFNDEVERLFGPGAPPLMVPESAAEDGITNIADNAVVDLGNASLFADGARAIATWVVAQGSRTTRCADYGSDPCVDEFTAWLLPSAFRRPVASDETAELRGLFDELHADYDYDYAFAGIVRAVLLSPDFLYRSELGESGSANLTPHEIANLMAFAITDKSPDAQLQAAADNATLSDPDEREAQARRLMQSSELSWQRFFWEWLHMATLYSQGEEVGLDAALIEQMEQEFRAFVAEVVVSQRGSLRDVLSAPYTFIEPELAQHYDVPHPGNGLARVELDPDERGGLLTQGAWLVAHGKRGRDNVVRRGMNIYKHAMCNNSLSPPAGLDVQAELARLVGPDATVRETVEARGEAPTCGGCHRVADPVGLVFETFASDGRYRTTYPDGRPVDSAIELDGLGNFDNARTFATALADDADFQRCLVQRYTHFLVGVDLGSPRMVAWTQQAHERFVESGTSLEELLVAIVRHPAFIERRSEAAP